MAKLSAHGTEIARFNKVKTLRDPAGDFSWEYRISIRSDRVVLRQSRPHYPNSTSSFDTHMKTGRPWADWSGWKRWMVLRKEVTFQEAIDHFADLGWRREA